jgi:hypothetical protein
VNVLCLYDRDYISEISRDIIGKISSVVEKSGGRFESMKLGAQDLAFCFGCLHCWTSGTGTCVSKDKSADIDEKLPGCDLIIFLTPVFFGTYSPTMKTCIDKGIGTKLTDTNEHHYPQLIIGYGSDITDDEAACFIGMTENHRGAADVVHPELANIPVDVSVTRSLSDNDKVLGKFINRYESGAGV